MRILQVLPSLYSGGVERGTVEFASDLARKGHESYVLSSGGPLVTQLIAQGSTHITLPVHRKSLRSFGQIRPVRALLRSLKPDIVHVRSRMPAWIVWLARNGLAESERPGLVSTFHGLYSVNPYSAIMSRAQHMIAVSECVRDYVLKNYRVNPDRLTVIQRGVDIDAFRHRRLDEAWINAFFREHPGLQGKKLVLMPGRISRWKGQRQFLDIMAMLVREDPRCHGIFVGGLEAGKDHFMQELTEAVHDLGLSNNITFLGQRQDMAELYLVADLVCHLSTKPEPFGRTVTEALASGTPVVAWDRGGVAETLKACFPAGLVVADDQPAFARRAAELLTQTAHAIELPERFHLKAQTEASLAVYDQVIDLNRSNPGHR
ncbi:MAG: glycosyltransferase family 4 protein [Marinobacter sp.]|nr:glycosyltransferase family 4 protein [Marinobacter sp.]